jgi:dipeptidyl aminopeptidase/acylaminoacyl peptidase
MLDLEQLLSIPYVDPEGGFDISPDGKFVAFSWNPSGVPEIYLLPLDQSAPPRQVTVGPGGKSAPKFSPQGDRMAYLVDLDGSEAFDIWVCDLPQGSHTNLTPDSPESIQPNISWSPDGSQIAFISDRSGRFATYLISSAGGLARRVFEHHYPDWDLDWSPDGRRLAVVSESGGQDYRVTIVLIDEGSPQYSVLSYAGEVINAKEARWSPDGLRLAFASDLHGFYTIGLYELESGNITWISTEEGDSNAPAWSADGKHLACVHSSGPEAWIDIIDLKGNGYAQVRAGQGLHAAPHFTPDGRQIVFIFENPSQPPDLWRLSLDAGELVQLTRSLPSSISSQDFNIPEHFTYPSLDGTPVPALLFKPEGTDGKAPGVIVIHGGPNWLFQFLWYPIFQHMVSRGWVVLAPNYRGSTGYGRNWQLASRFDLGGIDAADVTAGADYLVREGLADPQRIAITGRSHGGYLTMTCLTQYPERWAAGSAVVPFMNWFTSHANSRKDLQHWDIENMGDPKQYHDRWRERSPYFFLDRIKAPVQLICGTNDPRCPASESVAAEQVLKNLGKSVELVLYPDEGHSFLKRENIIDAELRRVAFLTQALEGTGEAIQ